MLPWLSVKVASWHFSAKWVTLIVFLSIARFIYLFIVVSYKYNIFSKLMQRIFEYFHNSSFTSDNELHILILVYWNSFLHRYVYRSYKLLNVVQFLAHPLWRQHNSKSTLKANTWMKQIHTSHNFFSFSVPLCLLFRARPHCSQCRALY